MKSRTKRQISMKMKCNALKDFIEQVNQLIASECSVCDTTLISWGNQSLNELVYCTVLLLFLGF